MLRTTRCKRLASEFHRRVRFISSYYKLFPETLPNGPPPQGKFDIDIKKLRNEYLRAQKQAHPDVSSGDGQANSAELSTAFRVLRDPVSRAEHILDLRNENPLKEGMASLEDEDLLMEIMMSREHVSEAETVEELIPIIEKNNDKIATVEAAMARALESDDITTAQSKLIELTYLCKLRQAADQKLEELK